MRSAARALFFLMAAAFSGATLAAETQGPLLPVSVELGDVSLTKLPFIMAADNGIYERNGLAVDQFITPTAAAAVREAGVVVPPQFVRKGVVGDINIGGGARPWCA
jgi:NitT/TauT family transport system substrate-binding protein